MKQLLSIVIPCLNEKQTISQVINDAHNNCKKNLRLNQFEIIVSDNGSSDGTLDILNKSKKIRIVNVPIRGYGAALHWGILAAKGEYVLFGDADMSYPFSNLPKFLKTIKNEPDIVLGSRLRGTIQPGAMPLLNRYFGTPLLTLLIRFLYQIPTSDCNSGMRLVKRSFYERLNMRNSGMEWASELLLKSALKKGKYVEVPIAFKKDQRNRAPHLSRWSDGWRHLKAILLLKPSSLLIFLIALFAISIATYVINLSFALTSLFVLLFIVLLFSYLALRFLEFAIESKHNRISFLLNSNMLVPWVIMLSVAIGGIILIIPENRLGSKIILVAILSIIYMWTFLIETIKTHMINRLPNHDLP